ncbi:phage GP46 family protein [Grimontia sp. NTOU-MAR1]|uniref:phage GP46 family protein n=1 Tax=Grimontia sp. NTOU-MAR1 TaxID=3111011 RepID=UPI002DBA21D3|nr:phage GP46 family protein [Grimontia sp. NTOU-MAR1]WRV98581.1 phage GP46 family protein [Grimontia sp. NTOU-MAR1]
MIGIYWHQNGADHSIEQGKLAEDDGLNSLVFMMLMTDARAKESDVLPAGITDRRGWPGDSFVETPWGSRLWLLRREKLTTATLQRAEDYAREALIPLLKGYAKRYRVTASRTGADRLRLDIAITKPDDTAMSYGISLRWDSHQLNAQVSYAL